MRSVGSLFAVYPMSRNWGGLRAGDIMISDGADFHLGLADAKEFHRELGEAIKYAEEKL